MILRTNNGCQPFYEVMGRFFADRAFIKEMDCQLYDSGFEWYLYYDGENICGFASVEKRDKYTYLKAQIDARRKALETATPPQITTEQPAEPVQKPAEAKKYEDLDIRAYLSGKRA